VGQGERLLAFGAGAAPAAVPESALAAGPGVGEWHSEFGAQSHDVGLGSVLERRQDGLGVVLAGGPLVYMAVMPIAGVAGDRLSRNQIIAACHLTSGAVQSIAAVLVLAGHPLVWALSLLSLVAGAADAFLRPAVQGLVQQIVTDPEQLVPAGASIQLAMNSWALLGPALAGLAITWFGPGWILAFDACSFYVASALFASLCLPR
jgi:MFS family permease